MNIANIFLPQKSLHCIICCGRFEIFQNMISNSKLCICENCSAKIKNFKSPSTFDGGKYMNFLFAAYPYSGVLKDSFLQYKFSGQREYYTIFTELLQRYISHFETKLDFDLIIPVPLSKRRLNERGFNQSALIAKNFASDLDMEYTENALFRIRHTQRQSSLNSAARRINVKNAFLADEKIISDKSILLIDDIFTIGATMNECSSTLLSCGAKNVVGLTLFKSFLPDNKSYKFDFETPLLKH